MLSGAKSNVVSLREASVVMEESVGAGDEALPRLDGPRRFPMVSSLPRLPLMIPDEILDYYGWVFCQRRGSSQPSDDLRAVSERRGRRQPYRTVSGVR